MKLPLQVKPSSCNIEMGCLPKAGDVMGVLTAPRLIIRGLSRRLSRWLILHHQRRLRKLSLRRYHRELQSKRQRCKCELPLITNNCALVNARVTPVGIAVTSSPSESYRAASDKTDRKASRQRLLCSFPSVARYLGDSYISEFFCGERGGSLVTIKKNLPSCPENENQCVEVCEHQKCPEKGHSLVLPPNLLKCVASIGNSCRNPALPPRPFKSPNLVVNPNYDLQNVPLMTLSPQPPGKLKGNPALTREGHDLEDSLEELGERGDSGCNYRTDLSRSSRNAAHLSDSNTGLENGTHHSHCNRRHHIDDFPQVCEDGRDGNWTGPGLQQLSSTASNTPGRLHPPSSLHSTRNLLPGNNSPVRKQPSQLKPPNLAQGPLTLPSAIKSSPQFGQQLGSSAPLEKAPKPPTSLSDLSDAKRPPFLPPCVERINIGDGVSVELSPLYRTLIDRPYFHVISRSKSKKLLEKAGDGVFLIRPSTRSSDPLTLCLQYGGRTYNINIRRRNDAHYALGTEKVNEMTFKSVDELVSTYSKEPIKLQSGNRVRLSSSPAKEDHIYVRLPVPVQKKY
ncbi:uncharacterized protein LOC135205932 isoform X2 [Macrobrachium nipponense]|uniref:uncharacterized protein LOC135205932 isoform X2 n=1 Tax=Macrobrachium nipponense TaxID=159736 RepID=UPI0030C7F9D3